MQYQRGILDQQMLTLKSFGFVLINLQPSLVYVHRGTFGKALLKGNTAPRLLYLHPNPPNDLHGQALADWSPLAELP